MKIRIAAAVAILVMSPLSSTTETTAITKETGRMHYIDEMGEKK